MWGLQTLKCLSIEPYLSIIGFFCSFMYLFYSFKNIILRRCPKASLDCQREPWQQQQQKDKSPYTLDV